MKTASHSGIRNRILVGIATISVVALSVFAQQAFAGNGHNHNSEFATVTGCAEDGKGNPIIAPGGELTIVGTGFEPGTRVGARVQSIPRYAMPDIDLETKKVADDGSVTWIWTAPLDLEEGAYYLAYARTTSPLNKTQQFFVDVSLGAGCVVDDPVLPEHTPGDGINPECGELGCPVELPLSDTPTGEHMDVDVPAGEVIFDDRTSEDDPLVRIPVVIEQPGDLVAQDVSDPEMSLQDASTQDETAVGGGVEVPSADFVVEYQPPQGDVPADASVQDVATNGGPPSDNVLVRTGGSVSDSVFAISLIVLLLVSGGGLLYTGLRRRVPHAQIETDK